MDRILQIELDSFRERILSEAQDIILKKTAGAREKLMIARAENKRLVAGYEEKIAELEKKITILKEKLDEKESTLSKQREDYENQFRNIEREWLKTRKALEKANRP
ncbi:MAG: hypothetical protein JXJ19_00015 [Elusimicrobia bacterium]|nr:hypothetical protein [Elusimicrobiota bacterium]